MKAQKTIVYAANATPPQKVLTPTEMVRGFRQSVLGGDIRLPFLDGVTAEEKEALVNRIRERAGLTG